jgi:hypothetical protein
VPSSARAELDPRCDASYETAQRERLAGRLESSRAELDVCIATCPAALVADCKAWVRELEKSAGYFAPVLRPQGASFVLRIDGKPAPVGGLAVAPGEHTFTLEAEGYAPRSERFTVAAGEVQRPEILLQPTALAAAPVEAWPTGAIALGATGIASLLASGVLAIVGHVDRSELADTCAPSCDSADVAAIDTLWTASAIAGAAGGALVLGAGIWVGVSMDPEPDATAAWLRFGGSF